MANTIIPAKDVGRVFSGTPQSTLGASLISKVTSASPEQAELTYGLLGLSPAVVEGVSINKAINLEAAANAWAKGTYTGESSTGYNGSVYRYSDPTYADVTWDIHSGNVNANHRYSEPGSGAVYAGTEEKTAKAEVASYAPLQGKVLVSGTIEIDQVLDLTDPSALKALGVTKAQIIASSHGADGSYNQTQRIAQWARVTPVEKFGHF